MMAPDKLLSLPQRLPNSTNLYPFFVAVADPPAPLLPTALCFDGVDGALPDAEEGEEAGEVSFELTSRK